MVPLATAAILAICLTGSFGCSSSGRYNTGEANRTGTPVKMPQQTRAEPKSNESKAVDPSVQSDLEKMEAEKRAALLPDAQAAIQETQAALAALDKGDKQTALAALQQASGKLDLVISRDPNLSLAPVDVTTTMHDLYASPDTVKSMVKTAKDDLANDQVQQARLLIKDLASEADINVTEIPLGTYPAAIKAVAPLIDAGRIDDAKAALYAVLHTQVIDTYVVPLPKVRAEAMLDAADALAAQGSITPDDKARINALIAGARQEIKLAEALGYGTKDNYRPLYSELDEIQRKADNNQYGRGLFDKFRNSLRNFKFTT